MASKWIMRVALNIEQLLQRPPGGIGRYAQIARATARMRPIEVDVALCATHVAISTPSLRRSA
jgi:hypothetical protein